MNPVIVLYGNLKKRKVFGFYCFVIPVILLMFMFNRGVMSQVYERTIKGLVVDSGTGKPLQDTNVSLLHTGAGASTNSRGEFVIYNAIFAVDTLQVSFMGYQSVRIFLGPAIDYTRPLRIELSPVILDMPEIKVTAAKYREPMFAMDPSVRHIRANDIQVMPSVGLPDIYRALQKTPGVSFTNEASTQMCVRGGNPDQNLVLIDGAAVYYPFHVFGMVSYFNTDVVDDLYFSPGGFSSQFGGRLSSVLSIQTKTPVKKFPHRINLNIVGGDITTGGKIGKSFGWVYSGRTSFFKLPNSLPFYDLPYKYNDQTLKLEFEPIRRNRFHFLILHSKDNMDIVEQWERKLLSSTDEDKLKYIFTDRDHLNWTNRVYSFRWFCDITDDILLNVQYYQSEYNNLAYHEQTLEFPSHIDPKFTEDKIKVEKDVADSNALSGADILNRFDDKTIKASLRYNIFPALILRAGGQKSGFTADYAWDGNYKFLQKQFKLYFDHAPADSFLYRRTFSSYSGFLEGEFKATAKLSFRQGLRVSKWNEIDNFFMEPRFNLKYDLNSKTQINLVYGHYSQGISTALEEGLIGFLELYFPVNSSERIETARHYIGSLSWNPSSQTKMTVTGYYKKFSGLLKSTGSSPLFAQTPGQAKGIEFELETSLFGFSGWCTYTWAHSNRTYNSITYDTNFDQRHRFQIFAQRSLKYDFLISGFWEFHTGQPYDPVEYFALIPEIIFPQYSPSWQHIWYQGYSTDVPRSRVRYPLYHRLDLKIMKIIQGKNFTFAPYISIRNVYNRANPLFYKNIEFDADFENGKIVNGRIKRDAYVISILPTVGFRFGF